MSGPVFFGIRHLAPAAAYHVRKQLDETRPKYILVEGPSDLNDQMKWLCHAETRFPAAILAYTKQAPVRSILYPFAIYSPEVQAILWAHEHGVPCKFMDLPSRAFLAMGNTDWEAADEDAASINTEAAYRALETLSGEDHDSFWERTLEQIDIASAYSSASNAFGRELRASVRDGCQRTAEVMIREAYMKRTITQTISEGISAEQIFCVCGAFHVSGLMENEPMTDMELSSLPSVDCAATLMPYSYFRLSSRSGYGAGNKAPAYFQLMWDALNDGGMESLSYRYLTRLAGAHRTAGNLVSSAEIIEAVRLANTLCSMRGSQYPCLRDLRDAAITTMGHGQHAELAIAFAATEIGTEIGFLPEGVSRTSVQEDFYRQLKALHLERFRASERQPLDLDLREKRTVKSDAAAFGDLNRSFFLHRLRVLNIHFASILHTKQSHASWGEYWELQWTPEVEIEIVESALLGDTIESAAAISLKERAESSISITDAASIFQDAFFCGMPAACVHALSVLQGLSIDAAALSEIAETAERLSVIVRYGDLRRFDSKPVIPLIEQLYLRACLTLENACICNMQAADAVTQAINQLNALQLNHDFLEEAMWVSLLERISNRDDLNTKCSGYAMATLLERGLINEDLLSQEVSRRLSPGIPAELGAGWFEGLAAKNRYSLITRLSLWKNLSSYLDELDEAAFRRALVCLRRAFSGFTPSEKNDIAENLGEIWGLNAAIVAESLMKESTPEEQAALQELNDFDFDDI